MPVPRTGGPRHAVGLYRVSTAEQRNVSTTLIHPVLAFRLGDQPCGWVD